LRWAAHGGAERGRSWERGTARNVGVGFRKYYGKMGKWNVEVLVVLVRVKGKGFKAWSGVLRGGGVVATDGRSGYRGGCTGRHRGRASAVGRPSGDAWARAGAGGGAREAVPAVGGGDKRRAEGEAAWSEVDEAERCQGIYLQFSKSSGTSL
jgi:hypothetical protein